MTHFPARCLPQAAQPVTVVWVHPDYDDTVQHVLVARDWESRGEDYIRAIADLTPDTRIVAVFVGHIRTALGSAINA